MLCMELLNKLYCLGNVVCLYSKLWWAVVALCQYCTSYAFETVILGFYYIKFLGHVLTTLLCSWFNSFFI